MQLAEWFVHSFSCESTWTRCTCAPYSAQVMWARLPQQRLADSRPALQYRVAAVVARKVRSPSAKQPLRGRAFDTLRDPQRLASRAHRMSAGSSTKPTIQYV